MEDSLKQFFFPRLVGSYTLFMSPLFQALISLQTRSFKPVIHDLLVLLNYIVDLFFSIEKNCNFYSKEGIEIIFFMYFRHV
jgi:hypothetical protein